MTRILALLAAIIFAAPALASVAVCDPRGLPDTRPRRILFLDMSRAHGSQKTRRPVRLPTAQVFNQVVSLDCFKMEQCLVNRQPVDLWYLNIIDRATSLQKCIRILSQTPEVGWKACQEHWINAWLGCPRSVITDGHGSFRDTFATNLEAHIVIGYSL